MKTGCLKPVDFISPLSRYTPRWAFRKLHHRKKRIPFSILLAGTCSSLLGRDVSVYLDYKVVSHEWYINYVQCRPHCWCSISEKKYFILDRWCMPQNSSCCFLLCIHHPTATQNKCEVINIIIPLKIISTGLNSFAIYTNALGEWSSLIV